MPDNLIHQEIVRRQTKVDFFLVGVPC